METNTFILDVPQNEVTFFKKLAKKMGWVMKRQRKSAYERSLDDEKNGRINHYENSEDFFKKMGI